MIATGDEQSGIGHDSTAYKDGRGGTVRSQPAAFLQHVGANPGRARGLLQHSGNLTQRPIWISQVGSPGTLAAWIARSMARRSTWPRCWPRRGSGSGMRVRPCMAASFWC